MKSLLELLRSDIFIFPLIPPPSLSAVSSQERVEMALVPARSDPPLLPPSYMAHRLSELAIKVLVPESDLQFSKYPIFGGTVFQPWLHFFAFLSQTQLPRAYVS